jgi:hypothetical protein
MYITTLWSCLPPHPTPTMSDYITTLGSSCPPTQACNVPPLLDITTECTQTTPQLIIKCNSNWTVWSTDGNRAMFLTLCSTPSTNPLLRDVPSNLAVPYYSFVCLSCPPVSILHPLPRPMRVGWGQKPKSLQLLIPLPAHPSLLPTPCTYPITTQNSSHFICHLVRISRWPSTLACHLLIFPLCYAWPSANS